MRTSVTYISHILSSVPPLVLGTISNLNGTAGDTTIPLTWTAAANATSHQPQYKESSSGTWLNFGSALSGAATSVTITGLTNGTAYDTRIVASDGSTTTNSNVVTATPVEASGATLLHHSDWSTATGQTYAALSDGDTWDDVQGFPENSNETLTVITSASAPAPFRTTNVLRITMAGAEHNGNLVAENIIPLGASTYGEIFVLNGGDTQTHNHPLAYTPTFGFQAIPYGMTGTSANWFPFVRFDPAIDPNAVYPRVQFQPGVQGVGLSRLTNGVWYRYRWHLHHYDPGNPLRYRIYPYVYSYSNASPNDLGTLLFSAPTYFQQDYGGGAGGSLQAYYNGGGYFQMNSLANARTVTWGQEGSAGATETGNHWYTSDFSLWTGGWGSP